MDGRVTAGVNATGTLKESSLEGAPSACDASTGIFKKEHLKQLPEGYMLNTTMPVMNEYLGMLASW